MCIKAHLDNALNIRDRLSLLVSNLLALIPCDFLTVRTRDGPAVGGFLDLAGEGVRHPGPLVVLRLVVPDLLLVAAVDLGDDELDVFRDEFALLKCQTTTCQSQCLPGKG